MTQQLSVNPPNTPIVDMKTGKITNEWWRFLYSLNRNSSEASAGEISTLPGSGLDGGGAVADGVDLSIADDGVTNAMLRPSQPCSVIGRYLNSVGNPADIQAVLNGTVLVRQANQLVFAPRLDGIPVGETTPAPSVNTELLIVASDPPASASAAGTAGTITWDSSYLYVAVSTDTWKRVAIATW